MGNPIMNIVKQTIAAGVAALTLAVTVAPAPAEAARPPRGAGLFGALLGGLVLGAIAAAAEKEGRSCGFVRHPVVDQDGIVVGYRLVRYCG